MEWDGGVEWNGQSGIGMGWRSGMGLRSPERVGKTSETSENVGGGLNEIWYMTMAQIEIEDQIEVLMKSERDLTKDIKDLRFVAYTFNH